jgi:hypothetical protein
LKNYFIQTEVPEEVKIKLEVIRTKRGWTIKKLLKKALIEFLNKEEEKLK